MEWAHASTLDGSLKGRPPDLIPFSRKTDNPNLSSPFDFQSSEKNGVRSDAPSEIHEYGVLLMNAKRPMMPIHSGSLRLPHGPKLQNYIRELPWSKKLRSPEIDKGVDEKL